MCTFDDNHPKQSKLIVFLLKVRSMGKMFLSDLSFNTHYPPSKQHCQSHHTNIHEKKVLEVYVKDRLIFRRYRERMEEGVTAYYNSPPFITYIYLIKSYTGINNFLFQPLFNAAVMECA